jgi:hypothetical protein
LVGLAVARLLGAAAVTALVGSRIDYRRPLGATFPQIAGLDTDLLRADASCIAGSEITLDVHVWSRAAIEDPLQEVRAIAAAVAGALHDYPLALPTNQLITLEHRGERVFYDQDGMTGHGVVEFRAMTQTT